MTDKELLDEFLEASKIDKDDIAYYGRFTSLEFGGKKYEGLEALYVELKCPNSLTGDCCTTIYFHHPTTVRLNND